jgi:hypothetical protein
MRDTPHLADFIRVDGLRLMQVALPVWIVSDAAAVDDQIAGPLRRRYWADPAP